MPNETAIQWTGPGGCTSNVIKARHKETGKTGHWCQKVSAGCQNCYSERWNGWRGNGVPFSASGGKDVEMYLDEKELHRLLASKKISGKMVFVEDMSDLFGEWVPFEWLDKIFAVFALRPDVIFQVLTKRPERMAEYLIHRRSPMGFKTDECIASETFPRTITQWPLPNVWLGTSCEDQKAADERIPHLLDCPAAIRFLSCEPLLGPIDLDGGPMPEWWNWNGGIHWVIIGGESGSKSRPSNLEWHRNIIRQCRSVGVAVFEKQVGRHVHIRTPGGNQMSWFPNDSHGGDMNEWEEDLRVRQFPQVQS